MATDSNFHATHFPIGTSVVSTEYFIICHSLKLKEVNRRYFSSRDLYWLSSIENIFKSASKTANFRKTHVKLRAIVGFYNKRSSNRSACPSTSILPLGQLITSHIGVANFFNANLLSSMIPDSNFHATHFRNGALFVLDTVCSEPSLIRQYLSHLNNSPSLGPGGISPTTLNVSVDTFSLPITETLIFLCYRFIPAFPMSKLVENVPRVAFNGSMWISKFVIRCYLPTRFIKS